MQNYQYDYQYAIFYVEYMAAVSLAVLYMLVVTADLHIRGAAPHATLFKARFYGDPAHYPLSHNHFGRTGRR